jgi:hypothetical protein
LLARQAAGGARPVVGCADSVSASADQRGARLAARAPRWRRQPRAARAAARQSCPPARRSTRARLGGAGSRHMRFHTPWRRGRARVARGGARKILLDGAAHGMPRAHERKLHSEPEMTVETPPDLAEGREDGGGSGARRASSGGLRLVGLTPTVDSLGLGRQPPVHRPPLADPR